VFVGFSDGSFTLAGREAGGYRIKHVTTVGTRSVNIEHLDGSFNFLSAEHPANDTYDPRTRPWYKLAAASNTTVWTDPYVFFTSRTPGVTAATAVTSSAAVSAVVGVDIELSGLSQFLGDLTIGRTGEAFVVSGNNVVAAPASIELKPVSVSEGSLRLRTIEEIGVPALNAEANERAHIATVDGQRELVVRRPFGNASTSNWSLLVRARESEFTSTVNRQHRTTFRIFVLGGLVVLLGMLLVMWRALRPLATLKVEASTDPLTGLVNRRGLAEQGEQLLGAAGRDGQTVGALAFDLDGFKAINDRLGHHAGDETLRAFAMYLRAVAGDRAIVARLGGDEFAIVRRFTSTEAALVCGETILAGLATGLAGDGKTLAEVRSSAGLALSSRAGYDLTALLDDADRSLTEVKRTAIGTLRLAPARPGAHPAFTATA
jgi:diguanylate cyclase (GGDEF)-like protein